MIYAILNNLPSLHESTCVMQQLPLLYRQRTIKENILHSLVSKKVQKQALSDF